MAYLQQRFERIDVRITAWLTRYSLLLLRIGLGIIFFWFGVLKFFPNLSPAQDLAARTITLLTFGIVPPALSIPVLAAWECIIGLGLFVGRGMRGILFLLALQMMGTITPLVLFPTETFLYAPFAPTLEGQYIIKNIVLICAALVLGATVRGGRIADQPAVRTV